VAELVMNVLQFVVVLLFVTAQAAAVLATHCVLAALR
jgi:hypothetical protein